MLRFTLTVLVTIFVLLFALQNFHTVPVGFFVGNVEVRLVFVIFSAMAVGATIPIFYGAIRRIKAGAAETDTEDVVVEDEGDFLEDEE